MDDRSHVMGRGLTEGTWASRAPGPGPWRIELALTPKALRRLRLWLFIAGALALIAGALCVLIPALASVAITLFIGWFLIGASVVMGADAVQMRSTPHFPLRLLTAALTFVAGLLLVIAPHSGTLTLTFLLSCWFFATGLVYIASWWQTRGAPGAGLILFNGIVSVALGLLIAFDLPSSADWAIGLLVGVNLVLWGIRALIAATVVGRALERT
jgi:uncharacterized membrane protein HdeD (DUF308 family)